MEHAHAQPVDDLIKELCTDPRNGLSTEEVEVRLGKYGPNTLPEEKKKSVLLLFIRQFHSVLTYILFVAAAFSFFAGERNDAYAIIVVVLINVTFGFVQERRAEGAIEKLRKMIVQEVTVLRGGSVHRVPMEGIVPGDIMLLTEGDRITADGRLLAMEDLQVNESALTGESVTVRKAVADVDADAAIGDRTNMVWMGTNIVAGNGKAVVVETGAQTEFGKIAMSLTEIKRERTPFEIRIDRLGKRLGVYAIVLSFLVMVIGVGRGFAWGEMFFFAVAMMVSVIPEGLPAVLAVVLAIGVQRMAKRNAIVRHVPSVETLGVTDVICTDKTGTLTENKMTVREIAILDHVFAVTGEGWEPKGDFIVGTDRVRPTEIAEMDLLLKACAIANRASLERRDDRAGIVGDPTEGALVVVAGKAGLDKNDLVKEYRKIDEMSFNSERKFHASLWEHTDLGGKRSRMMFVVGAYDVLANKVSDVMVQGKTITFDKEARARFDATNADMAERALRVLCIAMRKFPVGKDSIEGGDIDDLTLLGLVAMIDPPRVGVADAIQRCRTAGVRVMMITGDQKLTAAAIGREVGLLTGDEDDDVLFTEADIRGLDDEDLLPVLERAVVFARVTPQTKLRIVTGLQELGHTVAMTGDGVNDAPALKKASIGIAMGITGTDVSREVADIVLADDNFTSIVNAIEEGRTVFTNVKNTTAYLFMTNVGEVVTVLAALFMGLPLPLLPAQILWMNLVTDGFPDIALATEPTDKGVLREKPRVKDSRILSKNVFVMTALTSTLMSVGTIALFMWALERGDLTYARTIAFTTMAVFQLWNVFNMRSAHESMFTLGLRSNQFVLWAVILSLGLQFAVLYLPALQNIFRTEPLGVYEWMLIGLVSSSVFVAIELYKVLYRRGIIPRSWR